MNQIVELNAVETEEVAGGLFFVLLAANLCIWGYDAYCLSR